MRILEDLHMGIRKDLREENEISNESLLEDNQTEEQLENLAKELQLAEGNFYENLAERISSTFGEQFLSKLGAEILEHMDNDKEARKTWEQQIKIGIELLGTGFVGPDGGTEIPALHKPFDQSPSNSYSSAMLETLVSFISIAERELLPSSKVLNVLSTAEQTDEIVERNERVETYTNSLLIQKCPDFYSQITQSMLWSTIAGEAYVKTSWDRIKNKPIFQKVSPLDLVLPPTASDINTSPRIIHRYKISEREFKIRVESGFYRDIKAMPYQGDSLDFDDNLEEMIDGISQEQSSEDRLNPTYEIVEAHIELRLHKNIEPWSRQSAKGIPLPYIVHITPISKKVLAIYRNWEEGDETAQRLEWFSALVFFPGLFGRGYGLAHLAGENSLTATRLLRDMLNLNTLNIMPGGMRQQGLRVANNQVRYNPGEFAQIDTGGMTVQQAFERFDFPQPTPLMVEVKKDLEDGIRRLGGSIMATPENIPSQIGQVSMLAMMEKNSETQTTVLQRFHRGLSQVYKILFRLLRQYIPEEGLPLENETGGSITAYDFEEDMSLVPVSDPNLNSRLQRLMRAEAVLNLAQQHPELHNFYEIYKMIYRDLPLDHADKILIKPDEPGDAKPLDPLSENMNLLQGKPAKASIEQNHEAHMTVHSLIAQDPNAQPQVQAAVQAHIQEHQALQMAVQMQSMTGIQMPSDAEETANIPMDVQNQIAIQMAQAAQHMMEQQQAAQGPKEPTQAEMMMQEMEFRKVAQQQKNKIDQLNIQLKLLDASQKNQRDKYDAALRFFKETGRMPPSYEELLGEHPLTTSDTLELASEMSARTDEDLANIQGEDQQQEQQMQNQGEEAPQQEQEEEYNPPPLPGEEEQPQEESVPRVHE